MARTNIAYFRAVLQVKVRAGRPEGPELAARVLAEVSPRAHDVTKGRVTSEGLGGFRVFSLPVLYGPVTEADVWPDLIKALEDALRQENPKNTTGASVDVVSIEHILGVEDEA